MHEENQVSLLKYLITELAKGNFLLQEKVVFLFCKFYCKFTEQTSTLGIEGQMSLFSETETPADSM